MKIQALVQSRLFKTAIALGGLFGAACSQPQPTVEQTATSANTLFTNGDFESDAIDSAPSGWTRSSYINPTITQVTPQTLASLNLVSGGNMATAIVGGATESQADPDLGTGVPFRFPKFGQRAVRLNKTAAVSGTNQNANGITQTMTIGVSDVDPDDGQVHVRFVVAPVLENPGHAFTQQPYYFVELKNITKGTTLFTDFNTSGQAGVPWKTVGSIQYLDWSLVDVAPGSAKLALGDQVSLTVIAAGCAAGGHWGRIYVDGVGPTIPGLFVQGTGPQSANINSDIVYNLAYKNGGAATATSSVITMITPPSTTFKSVSISGCTTPAVGATGNISCPLGNVLAAGSGALQVTVKVDASASGIITNGNYGISASNATRLLGPKVFTTVTNNVQYADIAVAMSANVAAVGWGQPVAFTISATNNGPTAAPSVTVADVLPATISGVTWTCVGANGGTCAASGSGALSTPASLPVGASVTYSVSGTVIAGSGNGTLAVTSSAAVGGGLADPNLVNNSAGISLSIGTMRTLSVTKTGAGQGTITSIPAAINCGTNCGSASTTFLDGSPVVLTAVAPAGYTFQGWGGACASAGTAKSCSITMTADQAVSLAFGAPTTLTATGGGTQSTGVSTAFASPLAVLVADSLGTPIPGVTVSFAAPGSGASATLGGVSIVTDSSGRGQVSATANATPGAYAVAASTTGVAPLSFGLTNVGAPALVTIVSGTPQSQTVGAAYALPLVVRVTDVALTPIANAAVTFTVPGSGASASLSASAPLTNASGEVSVGATANTVAGAYAVSAKVGVLAPVSFSMTNVPAAPASVVVLTGSGQSVAIGGAFAALSAKVVDAYGNAVPNVNVTFSAPGSGASASLSAQSATTSSAGVVSFNANANTVAGAYTVDASVSGVALPAVFSLVNAAGPAASIVALSGSGQNATVDAPFGAELVAFVSDAYGNAIGGAPVSFSAPSSGASASLSGGLTTTNAFGFASVSATANTATGTYAVVAASGVLVPASFALTNEPGAPASIAATGGSSQSAKITTAFTKALGVVVTDTYGNAVPGVTIAWSSPNSGASATLGVSNATDFAGKASVVATANGTTGLYSVSASANGLSPVLFALTNTAGTPASIIVTSGAGQSQTVGSTFGAALVATVYDDHNNVIANESVTFSGPLSGASASFPDGGVVATDSSGQATIVPAANGTAGAYILLATVNGVAIPASFPQTNVPGVAASIAATGGTPQKATAGKAFTTPLVAKVTDTYGNAVPGAWVTLAAPVAGASAMLSTYALLSDASGEVHASAVATTVAGDFTATAKVTGVAIPASFALGVTAGAPVSIRALSEGTPQAQSINGAFTKPLTVVVVDAYGNVVPNAHVSFVAPSSGPSAALQSTDATTDANGIASITATADGSAGSYVVTALLDGGAGQADFILSNLAGGVPSITVDSGSPASATVATAFTQPLVVLVKDGNGNALPNTVVSFAAPAFGASAVLGSATAKTDSSGFAQVTATANTAAGSFQVVARTAAAAAPAVFTLTNGAGAPAKVIAGSSSSPQFAKSGTDFAMPLVVTVVDAFGNPVSGVAVSFTVPGTGATATLGASTITTDANGQAIVRATAGSEIGIYGVSASVANVVQTADFSLGNLGDAPSTLTLESGSPQIAVVDTAFSAPLVVVARDGSGKPLVNTSVTFVAPATPASAVLSLGVAMTDVNGRATVTATASQKTGHYEVVAILAGAAVPVRFALTNAAGSANKLVAALSSTPQSARVTTAYDEALRISVSDAFNNAVQGVKVSFAPPSSGATVALASSMPSTDVQGNAEISAIASSVAGSFVVVATVNGVVQTESFALTNTEGAPATITLLGGGSESTLATTVFANPLSVRIADSEGNPVSGVTLEVTLPTTGSSATFAPAAPATDLTGSAAVTLTANGKPGAFSVKLAFAGALKPVVVPMTILAIPTTMTLGSSATSVAAKAKLTLDVAVTGQTGTPDGVVGLFVDGAKIGDVTLANGKGSFEVEAPATAGAHDYSASYALQSSFGASTAKPIKITVTAATVTVVDDGVTLGGGGIGCSASGETSPKLGAFSLLAIFAAAASMIRRRRR